MIWGILLGSLTMLIGVIVGSALTARCIFVERSHKQ